MHTEREQHYSNTIIVWFIIVLFYIHRCTRLRRVGCPRQNTDINSGKRHLVCFGYTCAVYARRLTEWRTDNPSKCNVMIRQLEHGFLNSYIWAVPLCRVYFFLIHGGIKLTAITFCWHTFIMGINDGFSSTSLCTFYLHCSYYTVYKNMYGARRICTDCKFPHAQ